jgi:hypothetical protein
MKSRILYLIVCVFITVTSSFAQDVQRDRPSLKDRIFFGGGFGAGFGDVTFVNVTPTIGYRVTPKLSTGLNFTYQFTTFDYYYANGRKESFTGNDYGVGVFARQMLFGPIFLQAEYEYLNYQGLYFDGSEYRAGFNSIMAGAGISQPIGSKAFLFFTVLYNFSYAGFDTYNAYRSPYDSPWVIRIGITGGF